MMSEAEIQQARVASFQGPEQSEYRALSGLALGALVFGLLAPAALFWPLLWIVPLAGIVLGILAMRQIARNWPVVIGRKLALVGLILSVLCGAAAPSQRLTYHWLIRNEARQFAFTWFEAVRNNNPWKAHQLAQEPVYRRPLEWGFRDPADEPDYRAVVQEYSSQPEVRALLALGDKALVRYYDTEDQYRGSAGHDEVDQVYAVTYEHQGEKTTFFVSLLLERFPIPGTRTAEWRVARTRGGFCPAAMRR